MRRRVVKLWLNGNTYREVSARTGVSIGVISSIIAKERESIPDSNAIRELKVALIQTDTNPIDALRGAGFLDDLTGFLSSLPHIYSLEPLNSLLLE